MVMMVLAPFTAVVTLAATLAPCVANESALDLSRFQTVSEWPAASRLRAMRLPISPMPRNATRSMDCFIYSFSISRLNRNIGCEQQASFPAALTKN